MEQKPNEKQRLSIKDKISRSLILLLVIALLFNNTVVAVILVVLNVDSSSFISKTADEVKVDSEKALDELLGEYISAETEKISKQLETDTQSVTFSAEAIGSYLCEYEYTDIDTVPTEFPYKGEVGYDYFYRLTASAGTDVHDEEVLKTAALLNRLLALFNAIRRHGQYYTNMAIIEPTSGVIMQHAFNAEYDENAVNPLPGEGGVVEPEELFPRYKEIYNPTSPNADKSGVIRYYDVEIVKSYLSDQKVLRVIRVFDSYYDTEVYVDDFPEDYRLFMVVTEFDIPVFTSGIYSTVIDSAETFLFDSENKMFASSAFLDYPDDDDFFVNATYEDFEKALTPVAESFDRIAGGSELLEGSMNICGEECYVCRKAVIHSWAVVYVVPKRSVYGYIDATVNSLDKKNRTMLKKLETTGWAIMIALTSYLVILIPLVALITRRRTKVLVQPIVDLTDKVSKMKGDELDFTWNEKTNDEIEVLADSFADMTERIKSYVAEVTQITAEKERITTELDMAKNIQASQLPSTFPAFPDRQEFDIYAVMDPAKEVGGDFYDFFLIDDDHLGIVIADVSGKGIPAALFMMMTKIILKSYAKQGLSPKEAITRTNETICQNNTTSMFVTVWFGVLEISTGRVTATNAGHEYPMIKGAEGGFAINKERHGFVLGGMEDLKFREGEFTLEKGGALFVYTDGVPEATNADNQLFGLDRMTEALNAEPDASPEKILSNVRAAVNAFVGDAPQFDDLTMLCLKFKGKEK